MSNLQFVGKIKSDEDQRFDFIKRSLDWHIEQKCKQEIDLIVCRCNWLRSIDPWSKEPQQTFSEYVAQQISNLKQQMQQQVIDLLPYIQQGFADAGFNHAHLIIDQGVSVKSPPSEIIRHKLSW